MELLAQIDTLHVIINWSQPNFVAIILVLPVFCTIFVGPSFCLTHLNSLFRKRDKQVAPRER